MNLIGCVGERERGIGFFVLGALDAVIGLPGDDAVENVAQKAVVM